MSQNPTLKSASIPCGIHDQSKPLVLGSASPRRKALLEAWGYSFEIAVADAPEEHDPALPPEQLTCLNAARKAAAVARLRPEAFVIGADTLVYLDSEPLGKPATVEEAAAMLARLSGKTHQVCTGVAILSPAAGVNRLFHAVSRVTFRSLDSQAIRDYLNRMDPLDKAGGYALQEHGDRIVSSVEGSRSNVVGMPMEMVATHLAALGIEPAATPSAPTTGYGSVCSTFPSPHTP